MSFFKSLGKAVGTVAKVAAPVVLTVVQPEALINTALGTVAKHAVGKLPNDAIPYLNMGISTCFSYATSVGELGWEGAIMPSLQRGGLLAGISTALHQSLKLPTKGKLNINGKTL